MAAGEITEADLGRLGLGGSEAVAALRALGVWGDDGALDGCRDLLRALGATANSALALRNLERVAAGAGARWVEVLGRSEVAVRAATVVGASDALADLLASSPEALEALVDDLVPASSEVVAEEARTALAEVAEGGGGGPDPAAVALAGVQRRGLLRIAARDLTGVADTPEVAQELAALAEGVLTAAHEHVAGDGGTRLAVVGMGKLGGRELNYVSDVDVIFVAEGDWTEATKHAERLLRLLGTHTPVGRTYEIDTNLRPEGRDGQLVRSLEAHRAYYERWAKTWEFQALLKARHVAGDAEVGAAFTELVEPFVWPDRLEGERVAEIQAMKEVVESSKPVQRDGARQVKLAPGGLRDIEFAVQLLQLVHGRHDRSLRSPNTLEALTALAEGGYVDEGDAALFSDAYRFLRTVEHRIQLVRLRRSHTIPADDEERARIARSVGFRDIRAATALVQFDKEHRRVQGYTRRLHEKLFYRPLLERFAEVGAADQVAGEGLDEQAAADRLAALGFARPQQALRDLDALASGVSRRARLFRTLLPAVLPTLSEAPDPDGGIAGLRSLADRLGESPAFTRTLRDNPPVAQLLARVLGSSQVVGRWLERQPEVVSALADDRQLAQSLAAEDYRRLAIGLLRRGDDRDRAGGSLRRMKRREVARVAVRDLTGQADVVAVGRELAGIAEACLEAAVGLVVPEGVRVAVIGMGKLGGRELGYASDLDVLLVHEPKEARDEALAAAESLLEVLGGITPEGQAFQVDLGLRPEGKDGPLSRTLEGYRSYYERWAEPWELQALTLARPVAGDADLGAAFLELIAGHVYPTSPPLSRLQAVRKMKARVERERGAGRVQPRTMPRPTRPRAAGPRAAGMAREAARGRPGDRIDLKLGPGGLSDVEWTVQLLQLQHGGEQPALQVPGTLAALDALQEAELLTAEEARWLREGWRLATRVRNGLYLLGQRDSSVLVPGSATHEQLSRLLGYDPPGGQRLLEDLGRALRRVRKVHERRFYDA
jgi:[glutamine synthetase] adenylyltransferase / [glutamine synthetase]-adenylyl-L-tyrosine phosphorylase